MKKHLKSLAFYSLMAAQSKASILKQQDGPTTQILDIAKNSSCYSHHWRGSGSAPEGFVTGMALTFAKSLCRLQDHQKPAMVMAQKSSDNSSKDAIKHFQTQFENLNISTNHDGPETLKSTYTLGIGLGIQESGGKYCEGWDPAAGSNRNSAQAEAGLFQTSFSAANATPELKELFDEYLSGNSKCFLEVFSKGVQCADRGIIGNGEGATFQKLAKSCPAFATEFSMVTLRVLRTHFGPINRKTPEINPSCNNMFDQVEKLVEDRRSGICSKLL